MRAVRLYADGLQLEDIARPEPGEGEPRELLFDTAGRASREAKRIVTIAEVAPGATYFVVEPNGDRLAELTRRELRPLIDSTFPLADFEAAFTRNASRGKHGKVVLRVHE